MLFRSVPIIFATVKRAAPTVTLTNTGALGTAPSTASTTAVVTSGFVYYINTTGSGGYIKGDTFTASAEL